MIYKTQAEKSTNQPVNNIFLQRLIIPQKKNHPYFLIKVYRHTYIVDMYMSVHLQVYVYVYGYMPIAVCIQIRCLWLQ